MTPHPLHLRPTGKNRKFETNIPRKGIARPQSQFLHFMWLLEIYILPQSVCLFCWRKIGGPILGIYKSLTSTRMWKLGLRGRAIPFWEYINGIFVAVPIHIRHPLYGNWGRVWGMGKVCNVFLPSLLWEGRKYMMATRVLTCNSGTMGMQWSELQTTYIFTWP